MAGIPGFHCHDLGSIREMKQISHKLCPIKNVRLFSISNIYTDIYALCFRGSLGILLH